MDFSDQIFGEGKEETEKSLLKNLFGHIAPKAQELLKRAKRGDRIFFAEYLPFMQMAESYWWGNGQKDRVKAVKAYSILIKIAPNDVQRSAAYACRSIQFEEMETLDRAVQDTIMAIDLLKMCSPKEFEYCLYEQLGRQCEKMGDLKSAIIAYQEISKVYPKYFLKSEDKDVEEKIKKLEERYEKTRHSA